MSEGCSVLYGEMMHLLVSRLFPICRSITGNGVRETLSVIQEEIPIVIHEVPTGTKAFDWEVPAEWNIRSAYIKDPDGNLVCDFKQHNLHVMGYSVPVDTTMTLEELQPHLYSLPEQPDAIPYVTSYYSENWGFCLPHSIRERLHEGEYTVYIDSMVEPGSLTYAELFIEGETSEEIFLSSYICHPSMANNELSGPVVLTSIVKWLLEKNRKYSYRVVLLPETIGSIVYLSRNLQSMQQKTIAGFNLSCIGDERGFSYVATPYEDTLTDRVVENICNSFYPEARKYSFLCRGSDERQYCSPRVGLPIITLCRSKFGEYPEYHTSLDDLDVVTPEGLSGGFEYVKQCLSVLEANEVYSSTVACEPQLGKRGLYPSVSTVGSSLKVKTMMDFLAYCNGVDDLITISNRIKCPVVELLPIVDKLLRADLIAKYNI